jgi:hypothetical protein
MRLERRFLKMFGALSVLVLAALTIASCGGSAFAAPLNDGKLTICHATGNAATPYDEITLDFNGLTAHIDHGDDLIPAPAGGCPKAVETGTNVGKLTICHATGSATNPYNEIAIDFNGLRGHSNHAGDIIPAPQDGCPSVIPTPAITATATVTGTPSGTGTPVVTATPAATMQGNNEGKITICHATGSKKNPFVMITISVNGLNGHDKHPRDIIPAPAGGCPK